MSREAAWPFRILQAEADAPFAAWNSKEIHLPYPAQYRFGENPTGEESEGFMSAEWMQHT